MSVDVRTSTQAGTITARDVERIVSSVLGSGADDDPFNVIPFDPFRAPEGTATVADPVEIAPLRDLESADPALIMAHLESSAADLRAIACLVAFVLVGVVAFLLV